MAGLRTFASARAESYPGKPVRIIVPSPAGGPYDGIPRLIAQWIGAQHGWSIVIDNRSGASGVIGIMAAKQAPANGHTLVVVTTSTHGSMPALKGNLPYDPIKDFVPIVLMADAALGCWCVTRCPCAAWRSWCRCCAIDPVSSISRPAAMARRTISRP